MLCIGWPVVVLASVASLVLSSTDATRPQSSKDASSFDDSFLVVSETHAIRGLLGPACSKSGTRPAGSSFIQNSQNAKKTETSLSLKALSQESAAIRVRQQVSTSSTVFLGSVDQEVNDLVTSFVVVSLLLLVSIIGFVILESSHKNRQAAGGVALAHGSGAAAVVHEFQNPMRPGPLEPLPRVSPMRPAQVPQPYAPGGALPVSQSVPQLSPEPGVFYLCGPELVVPDGKECNLVIPSFQFQPVVDNKLDVLIHDEKGSSILRGTIYKVPARDGTRILLQSRDGDTTWARCKDSSTRNCFSMHSRGDQRQWGLIKLTAGGTVELERASGHKVKFDGPASGRIRVVDDLNVLLAVSEINARGRVVRVGPLVDVGFVMLCHLAQDLLQMESPVRLS